MRQLREGGNAIIHGAGGFIGRVVARTFAPEGATVLDEAAVEDQDVTDGLGSH